MVALTLGGAHALSYQEANNIGLTLLVVLYGLGVGSQDFIGNLLQEGAVADLTQALLLHYLSRSLIREDDLVQNGLTGIVGDFLLVDQSDHLSQLFRSQLGICQQAVLLVENLGHIAQQPVGYALGSGTQSSGLFKELGL